MSGYRPEFILISGYRFDHLGFVTDRDQTPPPTARARQTPDSDRKQQNELRSKIANPVSSPPPGMYVRATYIERESRALFSPSQYAKSTFVSDNQGGERAKSFLARGRGRDGVHDGVASVDRASRQGEAMEPIEKLLWGAPRCGPAGYQHTACLPRLRPLALSRFSPG